MPSSRLARTSLLALTVICSAVAPVSAKDRFADVSKAVASADLGKEFGRYDPARRCRRVTAHSDGAALSTCLKITKTVRVVTPSGPQIHVLLAGDDPKKDCHACAGVIAFATFAPDEPAWRLVARSVPMIDGSWGRANPPENFEVRKLGTDLWGWVETTSYMGQGVTEGRLNLYLPRDGTIVEAGSLPGDHDNMGTCEDGKLKTFSGEDCNEVKISLGVDTSRPEATHYPIVLTAESRIGARHATGRYIAPFDPQSFKYVEPNGIP